jgi:DNA-binding MarR family transcriptional regulator
VISSFFPDNAWMKKAPARHLGNGVREIERTISPRGRSVIGLYLFMLNGRLLRSLRGTRFAAIRPMSIGVPALLAAHPGISQSELADLMGVERMTTGVQVQVCIRAGLITRQRSRTDARKYVLNVTRKGKANLRRIAKLIPLHEQSLFGRLNAQERRALHRILGKLIDHSDAWPG